MNKIPLTVRLATQGMVGFGPAPGTMGTFMMLPLAYFLGSCGLPYTFHIMLLLVVLFFGFYIVQNALPTFNYTDASAIVMDEMVAFLWVFVGIPMKWWTLLIGFILFRLFDIYKPFGIAYIERLPGVFGIMADDLVAAVLSNGILMAIVYGMGCI